LSLLLAHGCPQLPDVGEPPAAPGDPAGARPDALNIIDPDDRREPANSSFAVGSMATPE
jgi:hypothetical protein